MVAAGGVAILARVMSLCARAFGTGPVIDAQARALVDADGIDPIATVLEVAALTLRWAASEL